MQYYTPDSSVYVHSYLCIEETFIGPRGFKQAWNLDKISSTIKHGICNSTTSKNGNGRRSVKKLDPFQTNMGELCGRDRYWGKKAANVQVGTLLSVIDKERLQIYKNLPMLAEERADTQKIWKDSQTTLNPNKISCTNNICLILVHRNRVKSSMHI